MANDRLEAGEITFEPKDKLLHIDIVRWEPWYRGARTGDGCVCKRICTRKKGAKKRHPPAPTAAQARRLI